MMLSPSAIHSSIFPCFVGHVEVNACVRVHRAKLGDDTLDLHSLVDDVVRCRVVVCE